MKATDLMIGDWMSFQELGKTLFVTIVSIEQREGYGRIGGYTFILRDEQKRTLYVRRQSVKPIPLTPEILEKNGFELRRETVWRWISEDERTEIRLVLGAHYIHIIKNAYYEDEVEFSLPCPNCVHELQHALKLCGIDKEIIL